MTEMSNQVEDDLIEDHKSANRTMGRLAFSLAVLSLVPRFWVAPKNLVGQIIFGFWAFAPALWLFVEWYWFLKPAVEEKLLPVDQVVHQQSIVRALWAAYLVLVVGTYGLVDL